MKLAPFNEPEVCLLNNWTDARLLEDGMKAVRNKYLEIIQKVVEKVQKNHSDLASVKLSFGRDGSYGEIVLGKAKWPKGPNGLPSGFFIDSIHVDHLSSPELERPEKSFFVFEADQKEVQDKICKAATAILGQAVFRNWEPCDYTNGAGFWCPLEPREELLELLVKDEARGFIDRMVGHFKQMARLAPVLDEIATRKRGRK